MKLSKISRAQVEIISEYIKDRTIEYGLWLNDLGMFGTDIPHFQIISHNYLRCMLKRDIKESSITTLSGVQLDTVIDASLAALRKVYLLKFEATKRKGICADT